VESFVVNQISVPPIPPSIPLSFVGNRTEFRRLVTRGAWLELVTVGFYRFWLATDIRRHLWSHTVVDGDAAEYTGRGKELLIGFLIALAILVPIYLAYFIAGLEAERVKAFASLPLVAFLYVFGQFVIYRARRYRLTRTVWRGVRFWMSGSSWTYALRASLWGILVVLTLGLALPWREAALERYKMRHSYYGDLRGRFEGSGWIFFKRGWWLWPLAALSIIVFPLAPFVYGAFKAVEMRWWISGIRFGDVRLVSSLPRSALISLYWKVIGWAALLLVIFAIYMGSSFFLIGLASGKSLQVLLKAHDVAASIPFLVATAVGYLLLILSVNVVMRVYLLRDLWERVANSISVHNIGAASNVTVKGDLANALGEGLADGLDIAGF
jgi:uncharacterized membrane protein YjgN (DUF898 family)